ncbi:MAG TPA: PqqD family protein [Blastocatellia bacterium]|nr:PqqD family protein [Blastocatellia bacterium]
MTTGKQQFVTKEQASFTELIDHQESIILDLDNLHYYSLNAAATLLWKHLRAASANSIEALSGKLATAFNLNPATAESDTRQFVEELLQERLLVLTEGEIVGHSAFSFPSANELPAYERPAVKSSNSVRELNLAGGASTGGPGALGGGS